MRLVEWTDRHGYKHRSWVPDNCPDEDAQKGLIQDPPNLDSLDWEEIKKDLHNALVNAGIFSWKDVQEKRGLPGAILVAMKNKLVYLYREADKHD